MEDLIFSGASTLKLDSKHRVMIPSAFRTELARGMSAEARAAAPRDENGAIKGNGWITMVLLPDFTEEGVVDVLPHCMLRKMAADLNRAEDLGQNVDDLRDIIFGAAQPVGLDDAGRAVLSADIQKAAGLNGHAHLVGQGNKFQIWNPERHAERHPPSKRIRGSAVYRAMLAKNAGDAA